MVAAMMAEPVEDGRMEERVCACSSACMGLAVWESASTQICVKSVCNLLLLALLSQLPVPLNNR